MFALQTQGPEFESQNSDIKGCAWWPELVIPASGEVETGTSLGLPGQPSLLSKFQTSESRCLFFFLEKKVGGI